MIKVGQLLKTGVCYGAVLTLISCGNDNTSEVKDTNAQDEQARIKTEETGMFGGNVAANSIYSDFTSENYFENLDTNNDNLLDKQEFSASLFDTWDTNNDGILRDNEWNAAVNDYGFKDNSTWAWSSWDANSDTKLTKAEFNAGVGNTDMFESWDKNNDKMLDEKEYSEGLVNLWNDADIDGELDEEEYRVKVKKYYDNSQKKYMPEMG